MYRQPSFRIDDLADLHGVIRAARVANFVTSGANGLQATVLPLFLDATEGECGVLYGHVARANPQWKAFGDAREGEAMAIFMGPDAYVTPAWYPTKAETGKVVPTWNYVSVQAQGSVEFFDDAERLRKIVTRLTDLHEQERLLERGDASSQERAWAVTDAPPDYIASQLRAIVGLRLPIRRIEGSRKMSQNRGVEDRAGVAQGLAASPRASDREAAKLVPK